MKLMYSVMRFYAHGDSQVNRHGLDPVPRGQFKHIDYLDQICERVGGVQYRRLREETSPLMKGTCIGKASTEYRVGNSTVVNKSEGHDRHETVVIVPDGVDPDTDIVDLFQKYYGSVPEVTTERATISVQGFSVLY